MLGSYTSPEVSPMLKRLSYVGALALLPSFFIARPAYAGIEACGNIDVKANATCELDTSGGCTARCTPVSFEAQCSADLEVDCKGSCNVSASATCTASCNVDSCVAE